MLELVTMLKYEGAEAAQLRACAQEIARLFKLMTPELKDKILEDIFDGSWLACRHLLDEMAKPCILVTMDQAFDILFLAKATLVDLRYQNSLQVYLDPIHNDIEQLSASSASTAIAAAG